MPNHVTNVLTVKASSAAESKKVLDSCFNAEGHFDFCKIKPIPQELRDFEPHMGVVYRGKAEVKAGFSSNQAHRALQEIQREKSMKEELSDEDKVAVAKFVELYHTYGHGYWYDWCIDNWGTKWNAYDSNRKSDSEAVFQTAWSMPKDILVALSAKFPEVEFCLRYADEDWGSNCGQVKFKSGVVQVVQVSPGWNDLDDEGRRFWKKFAFETCCPGEDPKDYDMDENFNYIED